MGWLSDGYNWVKGLWSSDTATEVYNYSYTTMAYSLQQVGAVPSLVRSAVSHEPTQQLLSHLGRIAVEDLVPITLVNYANQLLQSSGQQYLDDYEDDTLLSAHTLLVSTLYLLQAATWAFKTRQQTQFLIRSAVLTIEAPGLVNEAHENPRFSICKKEECSTLRFAQGSVRDLVTYLATEGAISLLSYTPVIGGPLSSSLSVYHRGRYVLTVVLPEVCNRHQITYLKENSELALSLGLGHFASSSLVNSVIHSMTGIPLTLYGNQVEQLMLITHMLLAAYSATTCLDS
jgi:hypothetical protein